MSRLLLALALLTGSWLFLSGIYSPAQPVWGLTAIAIATLLIASKILRVAQPAEGLKGGLLDAAVYGGEAVRSALEEPPPGTQGRGEQIPRPESARPSGNTPALELVVTAAAFILSWFLATGPVAWCFLVTGSGAAGLVIFRLHRFAGALAAAAFWVGAVLLAQSVFFAWYVGTTVRGHDLPPGVVAFLAFVLRICGFEVAANGSLLALGTTRDVLNLAGSWDLVIDLASCLFAIAVAVVLTIALVSLRKPIPWTTYLLALVTLISFLALWLLVRFVFVAGLYVHRWVYGNPLLPSTAMEMALSPWFQLGLVTIFSQLTCVTLRRLMGMREAVLAFRGTVELGLARAWASQAEMEESTCVPTPVDAASRVGSFSENPKALEMGMQGTSHTKPVAEAGGVRSSKVSSAPTLAEGKEERQKAASLPDRPSQHSDQPSNSGNRSRVGFSWVLSEPWLRFVPHAVPVGFIMVGLAGLGFLFLWEPLGKQKTGKVLVVERHSTWEPTDQPYDTDHFGHDPSYSYGLAYQYCAQYFQMSRLGKDEPITRDRLADCDVLVIKIPTERYERDEIRAIVDFVEDGGGLLLIGDHTNVFNSSTYLNDICRQFGFAFAHDLLFAVGSAYEQAWQPGPAAHPAVQHVPPLHFAVGCSIDPGRSVGRAAMVGQALWSLPPEFHVENYHPVPEYRADMRFGAFIQLWAARYGRGRILAFGDSTIFSNFCIFQPGKAELLREMIHWLNHRSVWDSNTVRLPVLWGATLFALAALLVGVAIAVRQGTSWLLILAVGSIGWSSGSFVSNLPRRMAYLSPECRTPRTWVAVDRTVSEVPLALGAFNQGEGEGFGLFEQWIHRLGFFSRRTVGREAFQAAGIIVVCPRRSVPHPFREQLIHYVAEGGRLLVLDSSDAAGTTVNSLLWPFGLEISHAEAKGGPIRFEDGGVKLDVEHACQVLGGEPFAWIEDMPVASRLRFGRGSVMAIGFADLWNDRSMGETWMIAPEPTLFLRKDLDPVIRERYEALFAVLRSWMEDRPLERRPPPPGAAGVPSAQSESLASPANPEGNKAAK